MKRKLLGYSIITSDNDNKLINAWDMDGVRLVPCKYNKRNKTWTVSSDIHYITFISRMKAGTGRFQRVDGGHFTYHIHGIGEEIVSETDYSSMQEAYNRATALVNDNVSFSIHDSNGNEVYKSSGGGC